MEMFGRLNVFSHHSVSQYPQCIELPPYFYFALLYKCSLCPAGISKLKVFFFFFSFPYIEARQHVGEGRLMSCWICTNMQAEVKLMGLSCLECKPVL